MAGAGAEVPAPRVRRVRRAVIGGAVAAGHTDAVKTARWNWLGLVVASGICLLLGVVGMIAGALHETKAPLVFLMMSVGLLIGAFVLRRSYKRYEAEVLPRAAEELKADGEPESLDSTT